MSAPSSQYQQLCARVDEKFAELKARNPKFFSCRVACHSCCKAGITVSAVEKARLAIFLRENPEALEAARNVARENPHKGARCLFLSAEGACLVYEARPLVCRSHGAALQVTPLEAKEENVRLRDSCSLNYLGVDLASLPPSEVLNVDTLNTLLALLNKLEFPGNETRTKLEVEAILGG